MMDKASIYDHVNDWRMHHGDMSSLEILNWAIEWNTICAKLKEIYCKK